jgi:hypothetical protein|tara:strand:+ start:106 stop:300 length:195 start_codon:yes stop_codon:yes gene_type:complete
MSTFIEVTQEAFEAIVGDTQPLTEMSSGSGVERLSYTSKGMYLEAITNYYSKPITQYYIQDINA